MKKFFTLIAALVATVSMNAQSLCFCDANGNVYEDGATITMNETETNDFDELQIPLRGIYIKNASEDDIDGTLDVTIDNFAGDSFGCCFGTNCRMLQKAGTLEITGVAVNPGEWKSIDNTEWVVVEGQYENLSTKFELLDGLETVATLNINFVYADPAGIKDVNTQLTSLDSKMYNLAGQQLRSAQKGINIINGKKYLIK